MFRVEVGREASIVFDRTPGLRERVESTLRRISEAATELRRIRGSSFTIDDRFMQIRIGEFVVSYLLDLEFSKARVMRVEPATSVQLA